MLKRRRRSLTIRKSTALVLFQSSRGLVVPHNCYPVISVYEEKLHVEKLLLYTCHTCIESCVDINVNLKLITDFFSSLGESLTSRYSRNTDHRLHTSFSSGEFARLKPKDMSSPLASDHSDSGRRVISPIRRRSDDDVSESFQVDLFSMFTLIIQLMRWH